MAANKNAVRAPSLRSGGIVGRLRHLSPGQLLFAGLMTLVFVWFIFALLSA